jgi:hypothetical protein
MKMKKVIRAIYAYCRLRHFGAAAILVVWLSPVIASARPVPQGVSLFSAFMGSSESFNARDEVPALSALRPEMRIAVEARLAKARKYKPRIKVPSHHNFPGSIASNRRALETMLVTLTARTGIQDEAARFAAHAPLAYEWEGDPTGPLAEAAYADAYIREHPKTKLRPAIEVFALHRYRCAFEAGSFMVREPYHEVVGEPVKLSKWTREYSTARDRAAERYNALWAQLHQKNDIVICAVVEDIDGQMSVYIGGGGHPRKK